MNMKRSLAKLTQGQLPLKFPMIVGITTSNVKILALLVTINSDFNK